MKRAVDAYDIAAGWFESDNADALASKLYLKVADVSHQLLFRRRTIYDTGLRLTRVGYSFLLLMAITPRQLQTTRR